MSSVSQSINLKSATATTIVFPLNAAGTESRKTGATLAAGDFKILRHTGGVWNVANPTTATPTEIGTTGMYALPLTASELTPDDTQYEIIMAAHDVAGAEWDDVNITIRVARPYVDVGAWLGTAPNALISGRLDVNAQIVADKTGFTLITGEHAQIAADVLNAVAASYNASGTIGEKINLSGSLADPWNTSLPGAYAAGKAGYILGTNLNAKSSDIKAQTDKMLFDASNYIKSTPQTDEAGVTTLLGRLTALRAGYLDLLNTYLNASVNVINTAVNAIKAKTDNLPSDPADESLIEAAITASQGVITTQTDLIKAKTNLIPSSPAAVGSQMDLINAPNATAIAAIQSGLALASTITTVLNRLGAWTGSGRNTILGAIQAMFRKDADATVPTDVNANLGGGVGVADNTTDSLEAIRDRGDTAWGSGSAPTAAQNADAVWDELRSGHVGVGSFGEGMASVQGNVTGSVASVTGNVGGNIVGNLLGNVVGSVGSVLGAIGGAVPDSAGVTTLLARLSGARAGYLDALAGWSGTLLNAIKALARKDASVSADIGGTHLPSTDSEEALREKIDTLTPGATVTENITVNELNT